MPQSYNNDQEVPKTWGRLLSQGLISPPSITGTAIQLVAMIFWLQHFAVRDILHASLLAKLPKEKVISGFAIFSLFPFDSSYSTVSIPLSYFVLLSASGYFTSTGFSFFPLLLSL